MADSKKRKRPAVDDDSEDHQKSKKNKTGFPDPRKDSESQLSDQALKALSYAFLQFRRPKKWKFNKAKQNWLLRNFYLTNIPDAYVQLTVQYLAKVQGGVREKLVQDCKTKISESTDENPSPRARALLDALTSRPNE